MVQKSFTQLSHPDMFLILHLSLALDSSRSLIYICKMNTLKPLFQKFSHFLQQRSMINKKTFINLKPDDITNKENLSHAIFG